MTQTTPAPFVTAEDSQFGAGTWVLLTTYSMVVAGEARPVRFVVSTGTGYRAELPACLLEFCQVKKLINCTRKIDSRGQHSGMSVDKWCEHIQTHCHRYHLPNAEVFRDKVLKTYTHPLRLR